MRVPEVNNTGEPHSPTWREVAVFALVAVGILVAMATLGCTRPVPTWGPVAGCEYWFHPDHRGWFYYMTGREHRDLPVKACYDNNGRPTV